MFYLENGRKELYQWDLDVCLFCQNSEISQAHFCYSQDKVLISEKQEDERGEYFKIPNILLQSPGNLRVYGYTPSYTTNEQQFVIKKRPKPDGYVYTETEVYDIQSVINKSLKEAKESGVFDGKDGLSEWDYVITSLEDFTTEKLATMSGNVLVKGVTIANGFDSEDIALPASIKLLQFTDCDISNNIIAKRNGTKIAGYTYFRGDAFHYPLLENFDEVVDCHGEIKLYNCYHIHDSSIRSAHFCQFITDVFCEADFTDGDFIAFSDCYMLTNIRFSDNPGGSPTDGVIDFARCKHLSNIHADSGTVINYKNCLYVNGGTCDGYYTEEDDGKVQTVNTDGSKSLISVYDKTEIDDMFGDISAALDELHTYAQALVNGGAIV